MTRVVTFMRSVALWIRDFFRGPQVSDYRVIVDPHTKVGCFVVCVRFKGESYRAVKFPGEPWRLESGDALDLDSWRAVSDFVSAIWLEEDRRENAIRIAASLANDNDPECEARR